MTDTAKKPVREKKPKVATPAKPDPSVLMIDERFLRPADRARFNDAKTDEEKRIAYDTLTAHAMIRPEAISAGVMQKYQGDGLNLMCAMDELAEQSAKVKGGDMSRPEEMLLAQAHALDALFANLARRAHGNMGQGNFLHAAETYLRLALRAQNQCRATLETLSAIKNPPVVFAKQMNVSNGPQQVNNGVASQPQPMAKDVTHALENETEQNKLGGSPHELLPDTRTQEATSRAMPRAKALAAIHRAED